MGNGFVRVIMLQLIHTKQQFTFRP